MLGWLPNDPDVNRLLGQARMLYGNISDPDDEFFTGCTDDCPPDCEADHRGEE